MLTRGISRLREGITFFKQFSIHPRSVGSIIPSSVALCRAILKTVDWNTANRVSELGAGTGVLTHHILSALLPNGNLDIFEINQILSKKLKNIKDSRLRVYESSAVELTGNYDVIISGLPLLSLPSNLREQILQKIHLSLIPGGVFVQYLFSSLPQPMISRYFVWQRRLVFRNFPPAWVYRCTHQYR
ncbi:class I SAM-dependent methyltransferase [Candidatus Ishikawella capsulata]|uniref:Phospholipid N-methyltransferase n=1 Tax=Candidatus Ishikawaella capsulata Mpkobe TaxID=476281 RepID=C5WC77_9ENTR|nr:methyltransferase [Candidatus Ishikawaella capsulata]BAH82933.1 phospholipid N-methyltransferase [Candidatus Ishikawaella capsulata Mpkobe]